MSKRNKQYTPHNKNVQRPQRISQAESRKALVAEIASDPKRVHLINSKLASAYSLSSIAVMYVEEASEILHQFGCYLPFVENRIKMINGHLDGLVFELKKLFATKEDVRDHSIDTMELNAMLDKYFGYAEEDNNTHD